MSDYYLVRKRKLDVHELYKDRGIYWYDHGWNWRAYAAFMVGFTPLIPGFAKSIQPSLDVGGAWKASAPLLAGAHSLIYDTRYIRLPGSTAFSCA